MKIAIIKLGADGDVLRTIPLANALKAQFPHAKITWITKGDVATLLENQPSISEVKTLPHSDVETFNALYNFDVEDAATSLAELIPATKKFGFYKSGEYAAAFNIGAEYYLNTMFDDQLKKTNKKTYQEMMFAAADLPYSNKRYELFLTSQDRSFAKHFSDKHDLTNKRVIGIHLGASPRWPSKAWSETRLKELVKLLLAQSNTRIILFGGPNEITRQDAFVSELKSLGLLVHQNNPHNTKREFLALVSLCDVMVCSDSFSLHLSVGLGKKTIGLFFCTSPTEVEDYNLITKIISPQLYDFFPEKSDQYSEKLVSSISAKEVFEAINKNK